jgi:hypothetical protein
MNTFHIALSVIDVAYLNKASYKYDISDYANGHSIPGEEGCGDLITGGLASLLLWAALSSPVFLASLLLPITGQDTSFGTSNCSSDMLPCSVLSMVAAGSRIGENCNDISVGSE